MISDEYAAVFESRDKEEFQTELERFTRRIDFKTFSAVTVIDRPDDTQEFVHVDNTPREYIERYYDQDMVRKDPVSQHCKSKSIPIVWDRETYRRLDCEDMWLEQAEYGYQTGIASALHTPGGRHFFLGFDREQGLPKRDEELKQIAGEIQLFTVYAAEAAMRLLAQDKPRTDSHNLTRREVEALKWTMEGKTALEVGSVLNISERTALMHVNNAMHKLGCANKLQAVVKALKLGLIK